LQLKTSIGLEVHAQLLTDTKLFCSCLNKYGWDPNVNVCLICMGLPGSLFVLNNNAVDFALKSALALISNILQEI
jgi:aspartyl-tRNA(Asn)/glutamyl-tRNA(Gln) amidotransferase subunit B